MAQNLGLAAGQETLWIAHVESFPKAAWVVGEDLPASASPGLTGRLVTVLPVGTVVQVAGLMQSVALPSNPPVLEQVMAVPASPDGLRPGYVRARGLAVFETLLGHPGPGVRVFASVVGQAMRSEEGGLVLEVAVWLQCSEQVPRLVVTGLNLSPGLRAWESPRGGLAVGLGGQVVVLDGQGQEAWRSPAGEGWLLDGLQECGFRLIGPAGERCVRAPSLDQKRSGGLDARQEEGGGWIRAFRTWPNILTHLSWKQSACQSP